MKVNWNPEDLKEYLEQKFHPCHFRVYRTPTFVVDVIENTGNDGKFVKMVQIAVNKWFFDNFGVENYIKWSGYIVDESVYVNG